MESSTRLASLVLLLGEFSLLLAVACTVLAWLLVRQRRQLQARRSQRQRQDAQRNDYRAFVQREMAKVRQVRGRVPQPRRLLLRYLEGELQVLAGAGDDPDSDWTLRTRHAEQVIGGLRQLEAEEQRSAVGGEPQAVPDGARLRQLEAYRERFNRLHGHALEESAASRELRAGLREELAESTRARQLLERYEGRRRDLDGFLEAPDIGPLARRHCHDAGGLQSEGRLRRTRVLLDGTQRQIDGQRDRHRSILQQQEVLIRELRRSLEEAASEGDAQRHRHLQQVKALEEKLREAEHCARAVEKESLRRQRLIRDLVQRLEEAQQDAGQVPALEDAVDRFCEQAVEMQARIRSLEERLAQADAEILKYKARELRPVVGAAP